MKKEDKQFWQMFFGMCVLCAILYFGGRIDGRIDGREARDLEWEKALKDSGYQVTIHKQNSIEIPQARK